VPAAPLRRTRLLCWTGSRSSALGSPLRARPGDAPQRNHEHTAPILGDSMRELRAPPYLREMRSARCSGSRSKHDTAPHRTTGESRAALDRSTMTATRWGTRGA